MHAATQLLQPLRTGHGRFMNAAIMRSERDLFELVVEDLHQNLALMHKF